MMNATNEVEGHAVVNFGEAIGMYPRRIVLLPLGVNMFDNDVNMEAQPERLLAENVKAGDVLSMTRSLANANPGRVVAAEWLHPTLGWRRWMWREVPSKGVVDGKCEKANQPRNGQPQNVGNIDPYIVGEY